MRVYRNIFSSFPLVIGLAACGGGSGGDSAVPISSSSADPLDDENERPIIIGQPAPSVLQDTEYEFAPIASDPDNDPLSFTISGKPEWAEFDSSTGELSGTPGSEDIASYEGIVIQVSDGNETATLAPFQIDVIPSGLGSVTLSWLPPTQNLDGSPLTDLAGYRFYWGMSLDNYPSSVIVENPGISTYVIENLVPGSYFFATSAIDSMGNEGPLSNTAERTIP